MTMCSQSFYDLCLQVVNPFNEGVINPIPTDGLTTLDELDSIGELSQRQWLDKNPDRTFYLGMSASNYYQN